MTVADPTEFVKGGSRATATITGAAAGERVVRQRLRGRRPRRSTGTGRPLTCRSTGQKSRTVTVTADHRAGMRPPTTFEVLGKDKLKVKLPKTVGKGDRVAVKLRGLGAKERVRVSSTASVVAKGKANGQGRLQGPLRGAFKLGAHKLKVVGAFKNRKVGPRTFRVDPLTVRRLGCARLAAAVLTTAAASVGSSPARHGPAAAAAACSGATGVTVVVDRGSLGGGIDQVCSARRRRQDGRVAVHRRRLLADLRPAEPGFVCRINGAARLRTRA